MIKPFDGKKEGEKRICNVYMQKWRSRYNETCRPGCCSEQDALMSTVVNGFRAHLNAHFLRNPAKSLRPSKAFQLRGMRLASGISATRRYIFFSLAPLPCALLSPSPFVFAASACGESHGLSPPFPSLPSSLREQTAKRESFELAR